MTKNEAADAAADAALSASLGKSSTNLADDLEQLLLIRRCGSCGERKSLADFPRDRGRARGRAYWCKPCHSAYSTRWRAADPSRTWLRNYRSRAIAYGFEPQAEPFTADDIIRRDGEGCSGCGVEADDLQLHHFVPLSLGGNHTLRNVRFLCPPCNRNLIRGEVAEVKRRRADGIYPFGPLPSERFEEEYDLTSPLVRKKAA